MNRDEALKLIHENVSNKNLIKHMLAVEAVMRQLARHFKGGRSALGPCRVAS